MTNKTEYEYPYNLVSDVLDEEDAFVPMEDFKGSVEYVLCLLSDRERKCIKLYYENRMSYRDIGKEYGVTQERIRQIVAKGIRKLRHPSRAKYIKYGIQGLIDRESKIYSDRLTEQNTAYKELTEQVIRLLKPLGENPNSFREVHTAFNPKLPERQLEDMELSVRSYNCLKRRGVHTAREVYTLGSDELKKTRNLGSRSFWEVVDKLRECGYNIPSNGEWGSLPEGECENG